MTWDAAPDLIPMQMNAQADAQRPGNKGAVCDWRGGTLNGVAKRGTSSQKAGDQHRPSASSADS